MNSSARRPLLVLLTAIAGLLCTAPAALAMVELDVTTTTDAAGGNCPFSHECTLREALELVEEGESREEDGVGGEVRIHITAEGLMKVKSLGTLEVEAGFEVGPIFIEGPGADRLVIDGEGETRVFQVLNVGEAKISGLTVTRGHVGGPALDGDGGAGMLVEAGTVTLEDVNFTENTINGGRSGGAIDVEGGDLTIVDSVIAENSTDSETFNGNGGGIHIDTSSGSLTLLDTEVRDNSTEAEGAGGGIYQNEGDVTIEGGLITENKASEEGGGIASTADGSTETKIIGAEITDNQAGEEGGGVYADNGEGGVLIEKTTIAGNEAQDGGGGVFADGPTKIIASTLNGNKVPSGSAGGGVYVSAEDLLIESSTIAGSIGSGIFLAGSGEAEVFASTVAANIAAGSPAGGIVGENPARVRSSIFVGNTGTGGVEADCGEIEVTSEGHNILGSKGEGCTWSAGAGDQFNHEVELGALQDNGGPTETMAPTSRLSKAINQGSNPTEHDQRGKTRPVPEGPAFTDVGAVEIQAPVSLSPPIVSPTMELTDEQELACQPGLWETDTITDSEVTYIWRADGDLIGSGQSYDLKAADAGKTIKCEVGVDNGATEATATSAGVEMEPGKPRVLPTSYDFGPRDVNAGASAPQSLIVANEGGTTITITAATSGNTEFPIAATDCTGGGGQLQPGHQCTIEARFDPAATGPQSSTVTVTTSGGTVTSQLTGTGTAPALTISPSSFDFGSRRVGGGPSPVKEFEVTSSGTAAETLGAATVEGAGFALAPSGDGCDGETLAPGEHCTVEVVFEPASAGAGGGTLSFGGAAPASASLSGTGTVPLLVAKPESVDVGELTVGQIQLWQVELKNTGSASNQLGQIGLEGPAAGSFGLSSSGDHCSGTELEPGQACIVQLFSQPQQVGTLTATLSAPGEASVTVPIHGTAILPPPAPAPQPTPPAPPAPSSAAIAGNPGTPHVGDAEGEVPLGIACDAPAGTPCQVSLELLGGRWSGKVAAGATRSIDFPLSRSARKTLGERERMRAKAVLDVSGGEESSDSVLLVAPPEGRLSVRGARRSGDDLLVSLSCGGPSRFRCGGRVTIEVPVPDVTLASGEVTIEGEGAKRLPLTAAGRRFLDNQPRPAVSAKAVIFDPVYQRTETVVTRFRLGE